ncbi:hypothetical protein WCP94_001827 [Bilophila wadsworthia]
MAFSTAEGRTRPGDRNREASTRLLLRGPPVLRKSISHAAKSPDSCGTHPSPAYQPLESRIHQQKSSADTVFP